jgi:hypothetical protein
MTIYTSYFANIANIKNPISIAGKSPVWFDKRFIYKPLAPKYEWWIKWKQLEDPFLKKGLDFYRTNYYNLLLKLDIDKVLADLQNFYLLSDTITLLCYERPSEFCHRHIVADWVNDNSNIHCKEYSTQ